MSTDPEDFGITEDDFKVEIIERPDGSQVIFVELLGRAEEVVECVAALRNVTPAVLLQQHFAHRNISAEIIISAKVTH